MLLKDKKAQVMFATIIGVIIISVCLVGFFQMASSLIKANGKDTNDKDIEKMLLVNLQSEIKATPYKDLTSKYTQPNCVSLDNDYCYKSNVKVNSTNQNYTNVYFQIYKKSNTNTPVVKDNVSRAVLLAFSPPKMTMGFQADDHYTYFFSTKDNEIGVRVNGSEGYGDCWEPVWRDTRTLDQDHDEYFLHFKATNAAGGGWGFNADIHIDKSYFTFENGKQDIYSWNPADQKYFHVVQNRWDIDNTWRDDLFATGQTMGGCPYGRGCIWDKRTSVGPVYFTVKLIKNTRSIEI